MDFIGITERGDAALDTSWLNWIKNNQCAILISKNPLKLKSILKEKVNKQYYKNIILHCTITGMGKSYLEPNVPSFEENVNEYKQIKSYFKNLGFPLAKVVLRVDPIIPVEPALSKQIEVINALGHKDYFDEVRISFIDYYSHIKEKVSLPFKNLHAPLELRQSAYEKVCASTSLEIKICGEPDFECSGCVSLDDLKAFGKEPTDASKSLQRPCCACIAAKKELLNNKKPCMHNCAYCYWHQ